MILASYSGGKTGWNKHWKARQLSLKNRGELLMRGNDGKSSCNTFEYSENPFVDVFCAGCFCVEVSQDHLE